MAPKKLRFPHAFIAPVIRTGSSSLRLRSSRCRTRLVTRCAATKLLVVDLSEIFREAVPAQVKTFSERVSVDRDQAVEKTFVLYSSTFGYSQAMKKMKEVGLIEPDALSALEGTELYQRQYKTPDPYWAKMVCKDWDPKPTKWVIGEYFREEVKHSADDSEEYGLVFECKKKRQNRAELCQKIREKLGEMGIKARVAQRGESTSVVVTPAAGSVQEVVGFCQMMLRIPENMTYVFGGDDIVGKCVAGKGNIGICGKEVAANMTHTRDQVFVSEKNGMDALMEGVMYHAIF